MRSNSSQQPAPARAMSPSSMLLPRRGASPARGLAKTSNRPQRIDQDGISSDTQDSRNGRLRDSGWEQRGRSNAREREITRNNGRNDHYSPPPEVGDSPPRRGSTGHRSISPPRKAPMRSDAMIISQHTRRSMSPRDRDDARGYERPPFDRMPSDTRYGREYPIDMRRAGEYHDTERTTFGRLMGVLQINSLQLPNKFLLALGTRLPSLRIPRTLDTRHRLPENIETRHLARGQRIVGLSLPALSTSTSAPPESSPKKPMHEYPRSASVMKYLCLRVMNLSLPVMELHLIAAAVMAIFGTE
ncbi:hypothetical protein B0J17DRAFT_146617 [Rhizoctonia solani]|nr:hypothetical protein B0J17DRAFT_146617 [Rhizoctonia solani]